MTAELSAQPVLQYGPKRSSPKMTLDTQWWHWCPERGFQGGGTWNQCTCILGNRDDWPDTCCWTETRLFYEWSLPLDTIPYGSIIKYAKLRIEYIPSTPDLTAYFYKMHRHLAANDYDNWYETEGAQLASITGSAGVLYRFFDSTSAFVDSLETCISDSTADNYFSLGVKVSPAHGRDDHWTIDCCEVTLEIGYVPPYVGPIMITNVIHGVEHYDKEMSYVRGDDNIYLSSGVLDYLQMPAFARPPVYKSWLLRNDHLAETWRHRFDSTADGKKEKHFNWDNEPWEYLVHRRVPKFRINDARVYRAMGEDVFRADILSNIELYIPRDSIPFEFLDPWRTDQNKQDWHQYIQPYHVLRWTPHSAWDDTTSYGVFKNMDWHTPDQPFYSVRGWRYLQYSPETRTYYKKDLLPLSEGDGILLDDITQGYAWRPYQSGASTIEDDSRTSDPYRKYNIKFNEDSSVDTIRYKAHLLSTNEAQPTMRCSQRKLDLDNRGVYHLVYESAGEVWYTNSTDTCATWSPEEIVSDWVGGATAPSISVWDSSVYVAYYSAGEQSVVLKRRYKEDWTDIDIPNGAQNIGAQTHPVVQASEDCPNPPDGNIAAVVWESDHGLGYCAVWMRYRTLIDRNHGWLFEQPRIEQPMFPSITSNNDFINRLVVWTEDSVAYSLDFSINTCNNMFVTVGADIDTVSESYEYALYAASLTSNSSMQPVVAYEALQPVFPPYSLRYFTVKTKSQGGWNTTAQSVPTMSGYADAINPSIGAHQAADTCMGGGLEQGLRVAYHRDWGGGIDAMSFDCDASSASQVDGASYPSVVAYSSEHGMLKEAYSSPYHSPFSFAVRTTSDGLYKTSSSVKKLVRDLRVVMGKSLALIGMCDVRVSSSATMDMPLHWDSSADTLMLGANATVERKMRTRPFTVPANGTIHMKRLLYLSGGQTAPQGSIFHIRLCDAVSGTPLLSVPVACNTLNRDTSCWSSMLIGVGHLSGRSAYLSVDVSGVPAGAGFSVRNVYLDEAAIPKPAADKGIASRDEATLGPVFPNPFNPTARIHFSIPDDGNVRLSITDALGREVDRPLDGYTRRGAHIAMFTCPSCAGGVYLCHLQFGDQTAVLPVLLVK